MNIPKQYLPVMPYLILKDSAGFLEFIKKVFEAKEQLIVPDGDKIMHGEIKIHDAVIMFANATDDWKEKTAAMYIYVDDVDKVHKKALANGARELHPPDKKEYGYTSGFEDPFNNWWFIVAAEK